MTEKHTNKPSFDAFNLAQNCSKTIGVLRICFCLRYVFFRNLLQSLKMKAKTDLNRSVLLSQCSPNIWLTSSFLSVFVFQEMFDIRRNRLGSGHCKANDIEWWCAFALFGWLFVSLCKSIYRHCLCGFNWNFAERLHFFILF